MAESPAIEIGPNLEGARYDPILGDFPVWVRLTQDTKGRLLRAGQDIALSHDTAYWLVQYGVAIEIQRYRVYSGHYTPDSEDDPFWAE